MMYKKELEDYHTQSKYQSPSSTVLNSHVLCAILLTLSKSWSQGKHAPWMLIMPPDCTDCTGRLMNQALVSANTFVHLDFW